MNKTETERMRLLEASRDAAVAMRLTERVEPDLPIPDKGFTNGWTPAYDRVEKACSSSVYHGTGEWNLTSSHGARKLFSTRLLALRAMRNRWEEEYSYKLAAIDREIKKEIANPSLDKPVAPQHQDVSSTRS